MEQHAKEKPPDGPAEYHWIGLWPNPIWRTELKNIKKNLDYWFNVERKYGNSPHRPPDIELDSILYVLAHVLGVKGMLTKYRDGVTATVLRETCKATLKREPKDPFRLIERMKEIQKIKGHYPFSLESLKERPAKKK